MHKGRLRFRKGKGLAQGHRVVSAKLGQSLLPSAPCPPAQWGEGPGLPKRNSPLLPCPPWVGWLLPGGNLYLPSVGLSQETFFLSSCPVSSRPGEKEGGPGKDHLRHCPCQPIPPALPTWIRSMQCWGESADTHWISGLSLCRLKATAMSPHFWISGVDSTHQRR